MTKSVATIIDRPQRRFVSPLLAALAIAVMTATSAPTGALAQQQTQQQTRAEWLQNQQRALQAQQPRLLQPRLTQQQYLQNQQRAYLQQQRVQTQLNQQRFLTQQQIQANRQRQILQQQRAFNQNQQGFLTQQQLRNQQRFLAARQFQDQRFLTQQQFRNQQFGAQQQWLARQQRIQTQQMTRYYDWNTYRPFQRPPLWAQYRANFNPRAYEWARYAQQRYQLHYMPPPGWYYQRWNYGQVLPPQYWAQPYWLSDYQQYGLESLPYGYVWVQNGPDALAVDTVTGVILRALYGLFQPGLG